MKELFHIMPSVGRLTGLTALFVALLGSGSAVAQESGSNWIYDFVNLRVHQKNLRSLDSDMLTAQALGRDIMPRPRIVGGENAGDTDNAFQVALLNGSISNNSAAQFCGGTLVRPNVVVTAAHCSDFVTASQVQVLTGTKRLDGTGTRHDVVAITIHPSWNDTTFDNDVALWELSTPATGVPLATLATTDGSVGSDLLASGWGRLTEGGSSPIDLQKVLVPLVSQTNCNDSDSYNGNITDLMICAGRDTGGIDSCQGDSGGPLTRGTGNSILTGITSWGSGCARPNLFGVYTRVSQPAIRDFIEDNIGGSGAGVYQMHSDGAIWRYTGTLCSGSSCPGWERLDNNPRTAGIVAAQGRLFQRHTTGDIWEHTGTPCTGNSCSGWQRLDNNPRTRAIATDGATLYQLHSTGAIFKYTDTPCSGSSCPGWQKLDQNTRTEEIVAAGGNLYQRHNDGAIWEYTGTPCSGSSCPGWRRLDNNPRSKSIVANDEHLFQLHNSGAIWEYTGTPCSGDSCPGWARLDNNARSASLSANGGNLFQLHNSGAIWQYTGTPCSGGSCPGWQRLDNNVRSQDITAIEGQLYQRHNSGNIWEYTGTPCSGNSCPGWQMLDNNPATASVASANESD